MEIAQLTLYGRMIYAIECLLNFQTEKNLAKYTDEAKYLLGKFCEFTSTNDLASWQEEILPILPMCVLEAVDENGCSLCQLTRCIQYRPKGENCWLSKECSIVRKSKRTELEQQLYNYYLVAEDDFLDAVNKLYWIGASELYGHPTDMKESEMLLEEIIQITLKHHYLIPDSADYKQYALSHPVRDRDYFGDKVDCSYLLNKC